uniref:ATP synthase F0 subunit 8 n=1 Tax=Halice sp. JL-2018 TaxID=2528348 RepID=A0A3Q8LX99_9CRUS|nr:ATP synthase F0 subunit 8 [Halice sp. JL-2018]
MPQMSPMLWVPITMFVQVSFLSFVFIIYFYGYVSMFDQQSASVSVIKSVMSW